ncbi:MAG: SH3 domain-containing protein, partial [Anaerolineae bacterium]|nr:SH3 domain-containing protein [Anaerolineae bacterium]
SALMAVEAACGTTGRNQVCYGHVMLEAEPREGVNDWVFEQVGDLVDLAALHSLRTSAMDLEAGAWGVALMRLQTNLPEMLPGQAVTMIVFGDVQMTNTGGMSSALAAITATTGANVRQRPSTGSAVLMSLRRGESVMADGRLADDSWLRVRLPEGGVGWVSAELVSSPDDLGLLTVFDLAGTAPLYGPMQAFYFTTSLARAPCVEAPPSGILIQTPEGAGEVTFSVNGVQIGLGSTVFMQAQAGDSLYTTVLEGQAAISFAGMLPVIPAGTVVRAPLNEQGTVSGPPLLPDPYDPQVIQSLPVQLLERQIPLLTTLLDVSYCNNVLGGEIEVVAGQPITAATYPGGWNNAEDTAAVMPYTGVSMTVDGVPATFIGLGPVGRCMEGDVETCYNFPAYFTVGSLTPGDHVFDAVHNHPGLRPWYPDSATGPRVWTEHCVVHARVPESPANGS